MLLEKLCNANGVSGNEKEVRNIIKEAISPYADEITVDSMGNLIAKKYGKKHDKTVMLSAHTDEVGFIISGITKDGYLQFKKVGGIDNRVIISKKVVVGSDKVKGIIGLKAVHLTTKAERAEVPKISDLFIDIGAKDEDEAKKYVKLGDYAAFDTLYEEYGDTSIKAKAIDDRVGCYILCELIKKNLEYDTVFCFVTQEEVGLRGARIAAYRIKPDIALVLESTTCADVPGAKEHEMSSKLNNGVAVTIMDRTTIVDRDYSKWLYELAVKHNIPVQYKSIVAGGNDAGIIHQTAEGIKTASLSVPTRYLHSPASIASKKDIKACLDLAEKFLDNINEII